MSFFGARVIPRADQLALLPHRSSLVRIMRQTQDGEKGCESAAYRSIGNRGSWQQGVMSSYPIELKMEGRTVVVVGLGPVGRHKAAALVAAGARVIGVDPAAGNLELATLAGIEVVAVSYQAEQLHGASLVIAAGPTEVNGQVVADARRIGAWVCSTSDPEAGDFTVPAVWTSGPLV